MAVGLWVQRGGQKHRLLVKARPLTRHIIIQS